MIADCGGAWGFVFCFFDYAYGINNVDDAKRETKTDIMESTRVETEACDDTHSMTQRKARATWGSWIYIKSLLCQGLKYAP